MDLEHMQLPSPPTSHGPAVERGRLLMVWFYGTLRQVNFGTAVVLFKTSCGDEACSATWEPKLLGRTFLLYSGFVIGQEMTTPYYQKSIFERNASGPFPRSNLYRGRNTGCVKAMARKRLLEAGRSQAAEI